jgi:cyclopropane fatty-acyl-phospholipid synthase-like methyltransferase
VLRDELSGIDSVLEIGSGTGQHAIYFGSHLPHLRWQTSDRRENMEGINLWIADSVLKNVAAPLEIDVMHTTEVVGKYAAVFSANTAHIMSFDAVKRMFALVGGLLPAGGKFCLYGPFNLDGEFTSESNRAFDESLRSQDPEMGIRDLAALDALAGSHGMKRSALYALPANNMLAVWKT